VKTDFTAILTLHDGQATHSADIDLDGALGALRNGHTGNLPKARRGIARILKDEKSTITADAIGRCVKFGVRATTQVQDDAAGGAIGPEMIPVIEREALEGIGMRGRQSYDVGAT
jgi:hypothetical protein